jgi:hypothetical protein
LRLVLFVEEFGFLVLFWELFTGLIFIDIFPLLGGQVKSGQ